MQFVFHCFVLLCILILTYGLSVLHINDDPDVHRSMSEIVVSKGYHAEDHMVLTEDGFFLTLQRIPHRSSDLASSETQQKKVVLLMHGIIDSAETFVLNPPKQSIGFILADAGYDVWFGNCRTNKYSNEHVKYTRDMTQYWDNSLDEIATYDLTAMIDYVLDHTGQDQLYYIGHSMGTTTAFALLSENPEFNKKIKLFIAMAPVVYLGHTSSSIRELAIEMKYINEIAGPRDILPDNPKIMSFIRSACSSYLRALCLAPAEALGLLPNYFNESRIRVYGYHYPDSSSTKTGEHYAQFIDSEKFSKFDFGVEGNIEHYKQVRPPDYNLTSITTPVALLWSASDPLTSPRDVRRLRKRLRSVVADYRVPVDKFAHSDFTIGYGAVDLVYPEILRLLEAF